ncbi:MAG: hypothetical protein D6761_11225 [Candidatus Dadabacteria bacterium]|nr:MAG: hypothetical protein D6761_11225 [Candidatus Dadabacteria bacterium]
MKSRIDAAAGPIRHFAYGANLFPDVLERRRGICPASAVPARAIGWRRTFDVLGIPLVEPAFANLTQADGQFCWGVLYELSTTQLNQIRAVEAPAYRDGMVQVETADGRRLEAHAFIGVWTRRREGRPSKRYLDLLIAGARHHGLPDEALAELEATPAAHMPLLSGLASRVLTWERLLVWRARWRRQRSD